MKDKELVLDVTSLDTTRFAGLSLQPHRPEGRIEGLASLDRQDKYLSLSDEGFRSADKIFTV